MTSVLLGRNPDQVIGELRRLLDDLVLLRQGVAPAAAELRNAPSLHGWSYGIRPVRCLEGLVRGHPLLGNEVPISTSEVFAVDAVKGWARTHSRFYALGEPAEQQPESAHG